MELSRVALFLKFAKKETRTRGSRLLQAQIARESGVTEGPPPQKKKKKKLKFREKLRM